MEIMDNLVEFWRISDALMSCTRVFKIKLSSFQRIVGIYEILVLLEYKPSMLVCTFLRVVLVKNFSCFSWCKFLSFIGISC